MSRDNIMTSQQTDYPDGRHEKSDEQHLSNLALCEDQDIEPTLPIPDHPWPRREGRAVELDDLLMLERTEMLLRHCVFTLFSVTNNR